MAERERMDATSEGTSVSGNTLAIWMGLVNGVVKNVGKMWTQHD
jgi:hypothetical protein